MPFDLACCGYTPRINHKPAAGGFEVWCHPPSADALFVPPWRHGVLKCGSEKGASSTLSDAVDVVDGHVLHKVERARPTHRYREDIVVHHSTRPATDVPEMGKEGGGTSPRGGATPPPQRGWEIRLIWLIFFSCIFSFVSFLDFLLYCVCMLCLYW